MICEKCGSQLRKGAKFCDECGERIFYCENCHMPLRTNAKFCDECGTKVVILNENDEGANKESTSDHQIHNTENFAYVKNTEFKKDKDTEHVPSKNNGNKFITFITIFLVISVFAVIFVIVSMTNSNNSSSKNTEISTEATTESTTVKYTVERTDVLDDSRLPVLKVYHNTADGIEITWGHKYIGKKNIKYIYLDFSFENTVGDPAYDRLTGLDKKELRITGPCSPGETIMLYETIIAYGADIDDVQIDEIRFEYDDGTSDSFWYGYHNTSIFYDAELRQEDMDYLLSK